ncbi:unnamed protein product, partial [Laminaria digitata]
QGKYHEADQLYQRARAMLEKGCGPDHRLVASVLNDWAGSLRAQVRTAKLPRFFFP